VSEATASTQAARPLSRARTAHTSLAVGVAALTVALTVATLVLAVGAHEDDAGLMGPLVFAFAVVPAGTGLAVALRRPDNVIGWLLLAEGAFVALGVFGDMYARYALIAHPGSLPGGRWAALWSDASWPMLFAPIAAIAFVMPNGRYLDETWRHRARLSFAAFGVLFVTGFVQPKRFDPPFQDVRSPLPRAPDSLAALRLLLVFLFLAALVTAAFAVRARFRQARGIERVQLLWFANAALVIPLALVVCLAESVVTGGPGNVVFVAIGLAGIAVPLSIGAAILRHGLFDIELVLSRTLVYGTLTALIVVLYFAVVTGLGSLVDSRSSAGLLAVGLVAVGIEPVRSRLQRRADRFVYGDRSTPQAALRRLSERLQGSLAPSAVLPAVVGSVAEALRLPYAAVEAGDEIAASHGEPGRGELVRLPMSYRGETVGRLVVEVPPGAELARADRALLSDLAAQAAVAVHAARLTTDLQRSRERLVAAREEERRRLRRDLHDGLGPDLAAIALRLDAARAMAGDAPVADVIGELREETRGAIGQIRQIVDELRPPALDELGLVSAIGEHAARMAPIAVEVTGPDPAPQLPAAVEVAAYRIALEAITNAARHAQARNCQVRIAVNGALELDVSDDGKGLPRDAVPGVGRGSMRERAAELGGSCDVSASPGGGTVVRARLPLERA
jgi:two-component system, NarL family, sensor kinase